jgi:predicted acylesterase/phospholipase RssA
LLSGTSDTTHSNVKTALVLSSGGLFGAYQVGAWNFLAETGFRPDIVIGASVGALNGWAIAGGADRLDLSRMWLDEAWSNVLRPIAKPSLRRGFFDREPLRELTSQIYSAYAASATFGLVVVQLPFLRSHLITGNLVAPNHLLATASIPIAMPFVNIDGKTFTDGGLLEDVPIWAALRMGATRIVAIDAMRFDAPWWYRRAVSPRGWFAPRIGSPNTVHTTLIRPSRSLGHYSEAIAWKRNRIQEWLDLGYADAQRAFDQETVAAWIGA